MNGPRDCHNEWSKSGTEWEISYDVWYKWTCLPKSNRLTDFEYEILVTRGKRWGEGTVREFEINMNTLLYLKWITNKTLLYSTENSAQCYVATEWEGSLGENGCMYVYDWVTLQCTWNHHVLSHVLSQFFQFPLSLSFVSDSWQPHGRQVARLLCSWTSPGKIYWSGLPCSSPGDLSDPGIEPTSLSSPALAGGFFTTSSTWEALKPSHYC